MKKIAEFFMVAVLLVVFAAPAFAAEEQYIPVDSWEYNALTQIASPEDYPDGLVGRPITRGDAAAIIAKVLPLDLATASEEKVETMQRLVDEYYDDLRFLGVVVNALDDVAIARE